MPFLKLIMLLMTIFVLLSGCKEKMTSAYLIAHPDALQQQAQQCQVAQSKTAACQEILKIADSFMSLVNEAQMDPQLFGSRLLATEIACVKVKQEKISTMPAQDPCQSVVEMLAVLGTMRPE